MLNISIQPHHQLCLQVVKHLNDVLDKVRRDNLQTERRQAEHEKIKKLDMEVAKYYYDDNDDNDDYYLVYRG